MPIRSGRAPSLALSAFAIALAGIGAAACDLPTSPSEARQRLSRGQVRTVTYELPVPLRRFVFRDEIAKGGGANGVIDTTDLTLRIDPDPIDLALGDFMSFDSVAVDPVEIGYAPDLADYQMHATVTAPDVPVDFTSRTVGSPLLPSGAGTTPPIPFDFTSEFATASFAEGTDVEVQLATGPAARLAGATVAIRNAGGTVLASSTTPVTVEPSSAATIRIPLGGTTLPGAMRVTVDYASALGTGANGDLGVTVAFANPHVTEATGVPVTRVTPVTFVRKVALDPSNSSFRSIALRTGRLELDAASFAGLQFTPDANFETDLAGKRVATTGTDSIVVGGTIAAAAGATTVDIATTGTVDVTLRNLSMREVVMRTVNFQPVDTVQVIDTASSEFRGIGSVRLASGAVVISVGNRLRLGGTVHLRLGGAVDAVGQPIERTITIPASGTEAPVAGQVSIPLAGATIDPTRLVAYATGNFQGTDVAISDTAAANAMTVESRITGLTAASVSIAGATDYAFDVAQTQTFTATDLGLDDVSEYLEGVTLNGVRLTLVSRNPATAALAVDSLRLTLVDGAGQPILAGGQRVSVLAQTTPGRYLIGANATDSVTMDASALINEMVQRLVAGETAGIRAEGVARFAGTTGTLDAGDTLRFNVRVRTPLDLTLPASGISIRKLELDAVDSLDADARDQVMKLREDVSAASVRLTITNGSPFAVSLAAAFVPMVDVPADTASFDAFAATRRFVVSGVEIPAGQVGADGIVTVPGNATVVVQLPIANLDVFTHGNLASAIRLTIRGAAGGRSRLTPADYLTIGGRATIQLRTRTN